MFKEQIFARLDEHNHIVDYPVTLEQIENRSHSRSLYTPIKELNDNPPVTGYHYKQKLIVGDSVVYLEYILEPDDLNQTLGKFTKVIHGEAVATYASELDKKSLQEIFNAIELHVERALDKLATDRGYKSIESLISHFNSTNEIWQKEARYANTLRDSVWDAVYNYIDELKNDKLSLPTRKHDVFSKIPKITWDNLDKA
jgi:hypothetical protein